LIFLRLFVFKLKACADGQTYRGTAGEMRSTVY